MGGVKEPTFKINPRFRLTTKHLSVVWHCVNKFTLECEAAMEIPDRFVFHDKNAVELLVQYHDGILDIIYHDSTDFETRKIQKWLRELMRDTILRIAKVVLPDRVKYWENMKGLREYEASMPYITQDDFLKNKEDVYEAVKEIVTTIKACKG